VIPKILIVGGGPAGAACAIELGRRGLKAILFERGPCQREKICGDILMPDAQKFLGRLGLLEAIQEKALRTERLLILGPRGKPAAVPITLLHLQRAELDQTLRNEAARCGAQVYYETEIVDAEIGEDRVIARDRERNCYEADALVLATGAQVTLAKRLGFTFEGYTGIAMRGYLPNTLNLAEPLLWVDKNVSPNSYGWICPGPGDVLNVGVGLQPVGADGFENLQRIFKNFVDRIAAKWLNGSAFTAPPKGFPLRAGLRKGRNYMKRTLLIGESAHCTYDLIGEGIGPALTSGILAGETLHSVAGDFREESLALYQSHLFSLLETQHRGYTLAQKFYRNRLGRYLVASLIDRSPRFGKQLAKILNEEYSANKLLSPIGFLRSIF
jgi:geranylgeranyl reductase family protein